MQMNRSMFPRKKPKLLQESVSNWTVFFFFQKIQLPLTWYIDLAIMALDHSRLGLESKSGRFFLRLTSLLYKILLTNLGACKPSFYTCYTSHLRWNRAMRRCFCHADLGQNSVLRNFEILIMYTKKLLNSDWLRKECSFSVTRVQITNAFCLAENTKETNKNQSD